MKRLLFRCLTAFAFCVAVVSSQATTVYQSSDSQYVAWEAEDIHSITNAPFTLWEVRADAIASGGSAIYQAGDNGTAFSSSFALYKIKFKTVGSYTLYVRWRGDEARTTQDANGANSYRRPVGFGDLVTDTASLNFVSSSANNTRVPPAANLYASIKENGQVYEVTQADIDAGGELILKVGTREWGMFLDRFVLSLNDALTDLDFNGLSNSETSIIQQGAADNFVAFEAERVTSLVNAAPTLWQVKADPIASEGSALYQSGDNGTAFSSSFALFQIRFKNPGTYNLYVRWRGDEARTTQDANGANSYRRPVGFGDLATDTSSVNYGSSSANNTRVPPAANLYASIMENGQTYVVTEADVASGTPLIFKVGTREWGMFLDRFVFSQVSGLTDADINSLPNSGASQRPNVLAAIGSDTMSTITLSFDRALNPNSIVASAFKVSGGVVVTEAVLNVATAKDIVLVTSTQSPRTEYSVTMSGVADVAGNQVSPGTKAKFTSWTLSPGWVKRELYFASPGTTVEELVANPNFPNSPDKVEYLRSVASINDPQVDNFGGRISTFFTPTQNSAYEFYIIGDDAAQLYLSSDESTANLAWVLSSDLAYPNFDSAAMHTTENLLAGRRYALQLLFQQSGGETRAAVAVRPVGTAGAPSNLPYLAGDKIQTFINPDAGGILFTQQPASLNAAAGTRATFSVVASAKSGGRLYYQWLNNFVPIPGANRSTYVTPVLTEAISSYSHRVEVSVNGTTWISMPTSLNVLPGTPATVAPFIGVSFVGGGNGSPGGILLPWDVAGVVQQENYNNIYGAAIVDVPLNDAAGASTSVTITVEVAATISAGTGEASGDRVLLQGYIHNSNTPLTLRLANVPSDNYNLIIYSLGFNYNTTYEESFALDGLEVYPTYNVKAQHAAEYAAKPSFALMDSTDENSRDSGNYVVYSNISPSVDGSLVLTVSPQSVNTGINFLPAVNGLQLVRVIPVVVASKLNAVQAGNMLTLSWGVDAKGFTLQSSTSLGVSAAWSSVSGVVKPLTGVGSADVSIPASGTRFYRMIK